MKMTRLGRTELTVSQTGFGALPIQRIGKEEAKSLLLRALDAGITYFDTARAYTDSEEKIGYAFRSVRDRVVLATKTMSRDKKGIFSDIDASLKSLHVDYIDIYQLHNPPEIGEDVYEGLLELKEMGKIRHIGITNHSRDRAAAAVESGRFDTLQFPLSFLSSPEDLALIELCREKDVGVLAMKGLAGGLINQAACAFAFLRGYENVVPLWGIERMSDLEEFISLENNPPPLDASMQKRIDEFKRELSGDYCRSCGYCLPCTAGIRIPTAARIVPLMNRARYQSYLTDEFADEMAKIELCSDCGLCKSRCPYGLNVPELLKKQYEGFKKLRAEYKRRDDE